MRRYRPAERARIFNMKLAKRKQREEKRTFSKAVMAGIMVLFFAGALLGTYATVVKHEPVSITLDYITKLALPVGLGYFVKAFGENIAKIILSAVFGSRFPGNQPEDSGGDFRGGDSHG
jgi:hypothetical protein